MTNNKIYDEILLVVLRNTDHDQPKTQFPLPRFLLRLMKEVIAVRSLLKHILYVLAAMGVMIKEYAVVLKGVVCI